MIFEEGILADVSAGCEHALFLFHDGSVWGCGNNDEGQLGDGTNRDKLAPVSCYPLF